MSESRNHNALIGNLLSDTLENCANVLAIVDRATTFDDAPGDGDSMGFHLILNCVRNALEWEVYERTDKEGNVSQLSQGG